MTLDYEIVFTRPIVWAAYVGLFGYVTIPSTKNRCALFLTVIIQQSLEIGLLPDDWNVGKVIPIYKAGDKKPSL